MKKTILGLIGIVVALTGLPASAAVALEPPEDPDKSVGCYHYEWKDIEDLPVSGFTGGRSMNVRSALQVKYNCNNLPTDIRAYVAVTCKYNNSPYPCSFGHTVGLVKGITSIETLDINISSTGSDGFYSRYTHWVDVEYCKRYEGWGGVTSPGLAGQRLSQISWSQSFWQYCPA